MIIFKKIQTSNKINNCHNCNEILVKSSVIYFTKENRKNIFCSSKCLKDNYNDKK